MFEIRVGPDGVARLSGRLDASQSEKAQEDLSTLPGPLTLDCAELEYISSAGLGVIVVTYKRLHAAGHTLRLANLQPRVRNVFTLAGFHRLMQID